MKLTEHPEQQYLDLLERAWDHGARRADRTGVGTRSLFGVTLRFDLSNDKVPLLTTKRVYWKTAARELIWFLSGNTNIRPLLQQGVRIWSDWPHARFERETVTTIRRSEFEQRILEDDEFADRWGDLGPIYGRQWTAWPTIESAGGDLYKAGAAVNQLAVLVEEIRRNPNSRRLIFTGWNVAELPQMALPPCHMTYQYYVADGRLSGVLYQRSCDLGLGFAFNIFEASLLLRMLAQQCDLLPGELVWFGADVHVYENHADLVREQLARTPSGEPHMLLKRKPETIFNYAVDDVEVLDYHPAPHISAPVAV